MARPRIDRYFEVDTLLLARANGEARVSEPPATIIRRTVKGCWNGDPQFAGVLANLFSVPLGVLSESFDGKPIHVAGGVLTPFIRSERRRGAWRMGLHAFARGRPAAYGRQ